MSERSKSGRFAYDGLDRVLHEKARLGLMTCLVGAPEGLTFGELKQLCDLTDGNLNRHLKQLAEADLVATKRLEGNGGPHQTGRPQTICCLTETGRARFLQYLSELQRVIGDAEQQMKSAPSVAGRRYATE